MTKAREVFVIMGAVSLLVAALWFFVYLRPSMNRAAAMRVLIEERDAELDNRQAQAEYRRREHNRLTEHFAALSARWAQAAAALPFYFDDTAVLRHIQSVIYPHTEQLELEFSMSELREGDQLYSTVVSLEFRTSYWQLLAILYNLVERDDDMNLGNRVVNYDLVVSPLTIGDFTDMLDGLIYFVDPEEDDIPEHLIMQFIHDFQREHDSGRRGEEEPPMFGLYDIHVEMEVEYLSIRPGLLSERDMRVIWALEDLIEEILN
jgi:hypothetical protein